MQKVLFCGSICEKPRGVDLCRGILTLGSKMVTGCRCENRRERSVCAGNKPTMQGENVSYVACRAEPPLGVTTNRSRLGILARCPLSRRHGATVSCGGFSGSLCGSSVCTSRTGSSRHLYSAYKNEKNKQRLLAACSEQGREARPFTE